MYQTGFYGGKFLPFHNGHLNCIFKAAAQCEKLYVVIMYNGAQEQEIMRQQLKFSKDLLDIRIREMVIKKTLNQFSNIEVLLYDCAPALEQAEHENCSSWIFECIDMVDMMGQFDACYSSEPEYDIYFKEFYPWAESILIDPDRKNWNISGTQLRNMTTIEAYEYLPRAYQQLINKSVLIVGTESCGKTTLVQKLSKLYNTSYTEEYGKLICQDYNMSSLPIQFYNDFLYGQKAMEIEARNKGNKIFFCDTDAIITNFYANLYEEVDLEVARAIARNSQYDLILYIEPTNKWVADGLRLHGEEEQRQENNMILKSIFLEQGRDLKILSGSYEDIYLQAIDYINELL